ncbi:MAG: phosphate starvation-inducible protein PhoH, partial [Candidatus Moranbacteria bacterium]|nr:phosphate starvation-inducible protein PhoH [Candidatus Moranbacteria bacterium]
MTDLKKIAIPHVSVSELVTLFGTNDKYITLLTQLYEVPVYGNHQSLLIDTDDEEIVARLTRHLGLLTELVKHHIVFNERDIVYVHHMMEKETDEAILDLYFERREIIKTLAGKPVYPKTINQQKYLRAIEENTLVFSIGPAGTGKTYLAVLLGLKKLKEGKIKRILLTRPAVEAGENLGFLPGDLKEKVDPYLRPLYDAMYE